MGQTGPPATNRTDRRLGTGWIEKHLEEVEAQDRSLRALVQASFDPERVLRRAADNARIAATAHRHMPLSGLTLGVKDVIRARGYPTACGTNLPAGLFNGPEAPAVSRLTRAGALVVGKTVTAEFACRVPGPTRNPLNPAHTPGGSSSGSAAGVAAGMFDLALGTQTVGSVIRPAAFCGVIGFRPTPSRIPIAGIELYSQTVDSVGVFTRSLDALTQAMPWLVDCWGVSVDVPGVAAIPEGPYLELADPAVRAGFEAAMERISRAGIPVTRVSTLQDIEDLVHRHVRLTSAELYGNHRDRLPEWRGTYAPGTLSAIEGGAGISTLELNDLRLARIRSIENHSALMTAVGIDIWVCPATVSLAPTGLSHTGDPTMNLPWSYLGLPVMTVPTLPAADGLWHGLQIVGRPYRDEALLSYAKLISPLFTAVGSDGLRVS